MSYENVLLVCGGLVIRKNHLGEIFISRQDNSCVEMRISTHRKGIVFTTQSSNAVEPTLLNNMIGYSILPRGL